MAVTHHRCAAPGLAFFRDLTARGLTARGLTNKGPVGLVTSDAHAGLAEAIGATLAGTSWQRCRTHYAANLMSATPKVSWRGSRPCCTASTTNPTPTPCTPSSTMSSTP